MSYKCIECGKHYDVSQFQGPATKIDLRSQELGELELCALCKSESIYDPNNWPDSGDYDFLGDEDDPNFWLDSR